MLVNGTELARALNLTAGRISQLKRDKVFHATKGGKFDLEKAQEQYLAHLGNGTGCRSDHAGDSDQIRECAELRVERERLKLENQKVVNELSRIKSRLQQGELVNARAAKLLLSRLVWTLRQHIWNLPLKFIHRITSDREDQIKLDQMILEQFECCFNLTNHSDIAAENAYILQSADLVIRLCETEIIIAKHDSRDASTAETALSFAREVRALFCEMKPELVEKLALKFHIREKYHGGLEEGKQ